MRKSKVFLLVAMVLVIAMVFGLVVGCTPKNDGPQDDQTPSTGGGASIGNGTNSGSGKPDKIVYADRLESFDIVTAADPYTVVNVKDDKGNSVKVDIKAIPNSTNMYRVYPPVGGYEMNKSYVIEVGAKASFVKYPKAKTVKFIINSNVVENVRLNGNVTEIDSTLVVSTPKKSGTKEDGVTEVGYMAVQTNGQDILAVGDIFIVTDVYTGKKEAFKVQNIDNNGTVAHITYEKPEFMDIYEEFQSEDEEALSDESNIELYGDKIEEELENTPVAYALATFFGEKPKFDVKVNKVDGNKISAVVSITIPNVVKTENGSLNLELSVENLLSATASSVMNKDGNHFSFNIDADVTNEITCRAAISAGASVSKVQNVKELIDKLNAVDKALQGEDDAQVPLFKWILPVANGAAQISYQADLMFRFSFSGQFDVEAKTTLRYNVGASYSNATDPETGKKEGLNAYAKANPDNAKGFESVKLELEGRADVRVGVSQEIRFDVLSGVLGVGFQAELGNYNKLYGYMSTTNLLSEDEKNVVGSAYLDGGFYYDINLNFGLKLGSLINLNQNVDIAQGDINLYEAGKRELILSVDEKKNVYLNAANTPLPTYTMQVYDLVTRETSTKEVPADMINIKLAQNPGNSVSIEGNNIVINNINGKFSDVKLEASIEGVGKVETTVSYSGSILLDNAVYEYDKNADGTVTLNIRLNGITGTPVVESNGIVISNNDWNNGSITLDEKELNKMVEGANIITVRVGDNTAEAVVNVSGRLSAYAEEIATNTYNIYCADQINDIAEKAAAGETFEDITFAVVGEIDMRGAELKQIKKFAGEFKSFSNATINNFVVNSMVDNNVALFGELTGKIENVAFEGNIEITFPTIASATHNIALVGVNNGILNNVKFTGNVAVNTNGIVAFNTKMNVAGLVAENNGTMTGCSVGETTKIDITVMFDLKGLEVNASSLTSTEYAPCDSINFICQVASNKQNPAFVKYNIVRR